MKRIRSTNVKTILTGALAKIQRGWIQGDYINRAGSKSKYCSMGAINSCTRTGSAARDSDAGYAAAEILGKAVGTNNVVAWNDEWNRTQAQVVAGFKKAIKLAK